MTAKVNDAGKLIEGRLDKLADEVRQPLTEYEDREKARIALCQEWITDFKHDGTIRVEDTAESVRARGKHVWSRELDPDVFGEMLSEAQQAKSDAVEALKTALIRLTKEEEDWAELERLRMEAAEREAREQAEREAREADARAEAEAKAKEEQRIAAEKAEQERIERAKQEAIEAERSRVEKEHAEQLAAERRRAEEAERAAQAEREKAAADERARQNEAERIAVEQAKREADQKHRSAVMKAAKEAIMTCGADEETAKKIVLLIRSGEVPNVWLSF